MEALKNPSQDIQSTVQDLSPWHPEYEAEGLHFFNDA
jgi:hypothetical protein